MNWERSDVIGLAKASCLFCHGNGLRPERRRTEVVCGCVWRAIFRACLRRARECQALAGDLRAVAWIQTSAPHCRGSYSRPREEYSADFDLVARRVLPDLERRLYVLHFCLGADWRACCLALGIDRGTFFHHVYSIEERLGRAFAELQPYALYPVGQYFARSAGCGRRMLTSVAA